MEEGGGPHDSGRRPQRARIVPARLRQSCENGTRAGRHEQAKSKADRVSGVAQGSGRPLELRRGQVSRQVPGSHSIDDPQNASDPVEEQRANASVGEERSQQERISAVAPSAFRPNPQSNAYRVGGVERQQPLEVAPTIQDAPPASLSNAQPAAGRQPTDGITPSALQFNRTKERLQASADNAIGKPYDQWALSLLQKVCTIRKIPRMSACRNRGFLVRLLQGQDLREQRKSPHIADLYDIAAGTFRCDNTVGTISRQTLPRLASLRFFFPACHAWTGAATYRYRLDLQQYYRLNLQQYSEDRGLEDVRPSTVIVTMLVFERGTRDFTDGCDGL